MSVIDVRVDRVSKQYRLGTRRSADHFLALDDVSFEVERGTTFGIIGPNGAGKSTLLRLLAGITPPSRGRIAISGSLAALIEVGSGFHPELTGRENVFLSGAILGLRRREIAARLDRIAAFAGVEAFMDVPVKWYSSGMYVRLGFAVAAHLAPDVLLVDEVLAVGDAEFQARCLRRIDDLRQQGVTVVFISHDLSTVLQICNRALLLERGRVTCEGSPAEVVERYHDHIVGLDSPDAHAPAGVRAAVAQVTSLTVHHADGTLAATVDAGAPMQLQVRWRLTTPFTGIVAVSVHAADGRTRIATLTSPLCPDATGHVVFEVPALPLSGGTYYITAVLRDTVSGVAVAWWDGGTTLRVTGAPSGAQGGLMIPHRSRLFAGPTHP